MQAKGQHITAHHIDTGAIIPHMPTGGPESPNTTHGAVRALERQSRHMNLFRDDTWLPATLEFFLQVEDVEQRTRFLQVRLLSVLGPWLCHAVQAPASA